MNAPRTSARTPVAIPLLPKVIVPLFVAVEVADAALPVAELDVAVDSCTNVRVAASTEDVAEAETVAVPTSTVK